MMLRASRSSGGAPKQRKNFLELKGEVGLEFKRLAANTGTQAEPFLGGGGPIFWKQEIHPNVLRVGLKSFGSSHVG